MEEEKLVAFPDGYSFVGYNGLIDKLIIGNSEGLVKVFNVNEPDLEPSSIDISENLTSFSYHSNKLLVTNLNGHLELVDLDKNESKGTIHRSELPLRDSIFINEGKRVICGGDDNKLFLVDLSSENATSSIPIPDQLLSLSYNLSGEILSISLANGNIQIYSVINEVPNIIQTLSNVLPKKINTSITTIDYNGEQKDDLQCTKTEWSSNGEFLLIPSVSNSIVVYKREDWKSPVKEFKTESSESRIIDFCLTKNNKHLAVLYFDLSIRIFDFDSKNLLKERSLEFEDGIPINIVWKNRDLYIGTSLGEIITIRDVVGKTSSGNLNSLFLDEADESEDEGNNTDALLNSETEEANAEIIEDNNSGLRLHEEDSMVIDEDEGIDQYYNKDVNSYLDERRANKRHKSNGYSAVTFQSSPNYERITELEPYSPGSTPWNNKNNSTATVDRRYLSMNSIAYAWAVKNLANEDINQQSITISFFDRSINKDYHFIDSSSFDLCSINTKGVLLGQSGFHVKKAINNGKIFYRNHDGEQDSWERQIPLLENEYMTSISISSVPENSRENDAKIIVGTNLGYLRFFNLHGICINVMKTAPIVTLVSSSNSTLFLVNQISPNVYTYSLIDINDDYKYVQQDVFLPLRRSSNNKNVPLIKGIFFNEYNDPCLVGGSDDTLLILQSWRETNNSKWVPLMNCNNIITEYQSNANKKNWKCWPLGLYKEELNCIILKNNSHYPGFPLPLPIELEINLPVLIPNTKESEVLTEEETGKALLIDQEDPEENFLRSLTMGKLVSDSLNSEELEEENDTMMERLEQYSMTFDKSLLKLFGSACKDYKLKKAFSIAKMIKADKALFAASKICERMDFTSLASKINKLREDLANLSDEEED